MNKILNRETILYLVFGVGTTIVSFGSFILANLIIGEKYYLISNIISFIVATLFAFVTNKQFVFCSRSWKLKDVMKEVSAFFAARIFTFACVEEAGLFAAVEWLGFGRLTVAGIDGKLIAKVFLAFAAVVFNYIFSKWVIFLDKEKSK